MSVHSNDVWWVSILISTAVSVFMSILFRWVFVIWRDNVNLVSAQWIELEKSLPPPSDALQCISSFKEIEKMPLLGDQETATENELHDMEKREIFYIVCALFEYKLAKCKKEDCENSRLVIAKWNISDSTSIFNMTVKDYVQMKNVLRSWKLYYSTYYHLAQRHRFTAQLHYKFLRPTAEQVRQYLHMLRLYEYAIARFVREQEGKDSVEITAYIKEVAFGTDVSKDRRIKVDPNRKDLHIVGHDVEQLEQWLSTRLKELYSESINDLGKRLNNCPAHEESKYRGLIARVKERKERQRISDAGFKQLEENGIRLPELKACFE